MTKTEENETLSFMEQILFLKRNNYTEEDIIFYTKVATGIFTENDLDLGKRFDELVNIVCELDEKINKMDKLKMWKWDE